MNPRDSVGLEIPRDVAPHLGFYVYLYVDPRNDRVFYVGKGQGRRCLVHLGAKGESRKIRVLNDLRAAGLKPRLEVLAHQLPDEESAFRIEAAVIDLLGLDSLTNEVRGWRSIQLGRLTLDELTTYYAAKRVVVTHASLLIRINRLYRRGMSATELYEATRGVWKLGGRRSSAAFGFAVFDAVVREVYRIDAWHPAGTTAYATRTKDEVTRPQRWEFTGRRAEDNVRSLYIGRSVERYFPRGLQSPVVYVNCPARGGLAAKQPVRVA